MRYKNTTIPDNNETREAEMSKMVTIGFVAYTIAAVLLLLDFGECGVTVVTLGLVCGLFCSLVTVFMLILQLFLDDKNGR